MLVPVRSVVPVEELAVARMWAVGYLVRSLVLMRLL